MARPIRIEFPGAYYHITSRGNDKKEIYKDETDYKIFLKVMESATTKYKVEIISFVLMTNHYHLLIHTPLGNLSSVMRYINGIYTQKFNWRHKKVGHVLQGRYKAILIEGEEYFKELIRYIHLNPYRSGMVQNIDDYKHSSHYIITNAIKKKEYLSWFNANTILQCFGDNESTSFTNYRKFISDGYLEKIRNPLDNTHFGYILGSESLIKWVQEKFLDNKNDRELNGISKINESIDYQDILNAIMKVSGKTSNELLSKNVGGYENIERSIAIYLINKNCSITQKKLGEIFGDISNVGISQQIKRYVTKYSNNAYVKDIVQKVGGTLNVKT